MVKVNIEPHQAKIFWQYVYHAIQSDAKSTDEIKEYCLAKLMQGVMYKLETLLLRYKQADNYRTKGITLTELEVLALTCYFNRYQLPPFLLPLQQDIMEDLRGKFPQLINLLSKKIQWQNFISESDFAQ